MLLYMNRDPIVEEVRQARQKILEACDGDLDKLLDRLKSAEAQDSGRVISRSSLLQQWKQHGSG